jgi:hypothetical protein
VKSYCVACRCLSTFRWNLLPPYLGHFTLKMEAAASSETLVPTCQSAWLQLPKGIALQVYAVMHSNPYVIITEWKDERSCNIILFCFLSMLLKTQCADSIASEGRALDDRWIRTNLKRSGPGPTEVLSLNLPGGTEKITKILSQNGRCPDRDSNWDYPKCISREMVLNFCQTAAR